MKRADSFAVLLFFVFASSVARCDEGVSPVRVEPALRVLPANHLKFYLHFRAPMERGEVFRYLRLVEIDANGQEQREVPEPFREVELWDESFTRLTLWFHPGRQKPGVNLNVEMGPILDAGKSYRLEIAGSWRDEGGSPLGGLTSFEFVAGSADDSQPEPLAWRVEWKDGKLTVTTGEALDPESVKKRISVRSRKSEEIPVVEAVVGADHFQLTGKTVWTPGEYQLCVDPRLEDLAGNSVARPFNRDLESGRGLGDGAVVEIPFAIPPAPIQDP